MIAPFVYTPEFLANIERTISKERLGRYLKATGNDLNAALSLYERNVAVSEALFGFLQGLEVTVRNSIHHALSADLGQVDWYRTGLMLPWSQDRFFFTKPMEEMIADARRKAGSPATIGKFIAELPFGFWPGIIANQFEFLWRLSLHKAFPDASVARKVVHWRLDLIRRLRNRIAHHEPIITNQSKVCTGFKGQPHIALAEILECVEWVCPHTALWLKMTSRYQQAGALLVEISKTGIVI